MAGQPKRRAMILELERRAQQLSRDEGERRSVMDYVVAWIEDGGNLTTLTADISAVVGDTFSRAKLSNYLHSLEGSEERLARARTRSAEAIVESVASELEGDPETQVALGARKQRIDYKLWVASRYNREQYGDQRGPQISISLTGLHLDALRVKTSSVTLTAEAPPALPAPADDAEFEVLPAS